MACYLTTAFAVAGMSAWMILRARGSRPRRSQARAARSRWRCGSRRSSRRCRSCSATCTASTCSRSSRRSSRRSRRTGTRRAGMRRSCLFAWPDEEAERTDYEIAIPKLGSYILTHDFSGVVPGLKDVPPDLRPPVWPVFFSFRIMVAHRLRDARLWGSGACGCAGAAALFENRWFLRAAMLMTPSGFGAVLFGWFTAEIGRQPFVVYGLLRTADAVSPVTRGAVRGLARHLRRRLRLHLRLRQLLSRQAPAQRARSRSRRRCAAPISATGPTGRRSGRSRCRTRASAAARPRARSRPR